MNNNLWAKGNWQKKKKLCLNYLYNQFPLHYKFQPPLLMHFSNINSKFVKKKDFKFKNERSLQSKHINSAQITKQPTSDHNY